MANALPSGSVVAPGNSEAGVALTKVIGPINEGPLLSVQLEADSRLPGMFPAANTPNVPYTPGWPTVLLPPIHAHSFVEGLYCQRSLRPASLPSASTPKPPKSQKLPLLSVQLAATMRLPGMFPAANVPNVPYSPDWPQLRQGTVLLPPIHAHWTALPAVNGVMV